MHNTGRRGDHIDDLKESDGHLGVVVGSDMHLAHVPVEEANHGRTWSLHFGEGQVVPDGRTPGDVNDFAGFGKKMFGQPCQFFADGTCPYWEKKLRED